MESIKNFEVWRPVAGYEGLYEVSNYGRVRSASRWIDNKWGSKTFRPGKILSPDDGEYGHLRVSLYKDKKKKRYMVHRLVAIAFIPNPLNLPIINHKDENPRNNFVWVNPDGNVDLEKSNLEWCSIQYNCAYNDHMKRFGQRYFNRPDLSKPIIQLTEDGEFVKRWNSIREAERSGIASKQNIMRVLKKKPGARLTAGFRWVYESEY